jgi:hypothetical protein
MPATKHRSFKSIINRHRDAADDGTKAQAISDFLAELEKAGKALPGDKETLMASQTPEELARAMSTMRSRAPAMREGLAKVSRFCEAFHKELAAAGQTKQEYVDAYKSASPEQQTRLLRDYDRALNRFAEGDEAPMSAAAAPAPADLAARLEAYGLDPDRLQGCPPEALEYILSFLDDLTAGGPEDSDDAASRGEVQEVGQYYERFAEDFRRRGVKKTDFIRTFCGSRMRAAQFLGQS